VADLSCRDGQQQAISAMLGDIQKWRSIAGVLDGALAFTCRRLVSAWLRSGSAGRGLRAGWRQGCG